MLHDLQDRLDRKDFEAGKQYYRMEDYLGRPRGAAKTSSRTMPTTSTARTSSTTPPCRPTSTPT